MSQVGRTILQNYIRVIKEARLVAALPRFGRTGPTKAPAQALFTLPPPARVGGLLDSGRTKFGVFDDNRCKPIHRWYPFVEGYSADLVRDALDRLSLSGALLDPFGGSGTTALAAAEAGHDSWFCEVNPYLAWVADVKVNQSKAAWNAGASADLLTLADELEREPLPPFPDDHPLIAADHRRGFFPKGVAAEVVSCLETIEDHCRPEGIPLARLAMATCLIPASNMIRRTDLRRRRLNDPDPRPFRPLVVHRLREIANDVEVVGSSLRGTATHLAADARSLPSFPFPLDLIVTSPPYLNGTNYCRNTKLELLALGFVKDEKDLAQLRRDSIAAGINTISRQRGDAELIAAVERVARALDEVAYDRRIPTMVRMYFSDMRRVFANIRKNSRAGASFLLDIGDSRFSGVHVPTHDLLCDVAGLEGWEKVRVETIRSRRSYDGSDLTQVLLEFKAV